MAKRTKRKINYKRIFVLLLLVTITIGLVVFGVTTKTGGKKQVKEVKEISSIKGYGYSLKENATDYYKKLFKELEKVLKKDDVDEEKYASLVGQMFIADFYNLDNKINKNDVGGKQFVYTDYQSDFEKYAMDSMYKSVENNVYGKRNQELPIVTSVTVEKVKNETYKYGDSSDDNAYIYNFEIEYKDDLGYQTDGSLIIIHNGKKLEVASLSEKSSN